MRLCVAAANRRITAIICPPPPARHIFAPFLSLLVLGKNPSESVISSVIVCNHPFAVKLYLSYSDHARPV